MVVYNNVLAGAAGSSGAAADYKIERSLRFNDADTSYLSNTPSSASSGNKKLTYSVWVKGADLSDKTPLYSASSTGGSESIEHQNNGSLVVFFDEWTNGAYYTTATFRDPAAWYHFVFVIDTTLSTAADRVKIYVNGERVSTTISGTLQQDHTFSGLNQQNRIQYIGRTANTSGGTHHYASAYFTEIHMVDGQALAPTDFGEVDATTGAWNPIEFTGSHGTNGFNLDFSDNSSNAALGYDAAGSNNWTLNNISAGGTVAATISASASPSGSTGFSSSYPGSRALDSDDSTQASANYSAGDTTIVTVNFNPALTAGSTLTAKIYQYQSYHSIKVNSGSYVTASGSVVNLLSGHGVSAGDSITSISYKTVSPNSSFALGNELYYIKNDGTNILASNVTETDSFLDSPTNYEASSGNNGGNYATISAVDNAGVTLSNGNLEMTTSGWQSFKATIGVSSGKWYWETQNKQTAAAILGVATQQASVLPSNSIFGSTGHSGGDSNPAWCWAGANTYFNGTSSASGSLSNHSATDIVMYALDLDNGKLWFGRNGTWYDSSWGTTGNPATGANATVSGLNTSYTYFPAGTTHSGGAIYNFGARPFAYTIPTGFKSLCTQNLDDPTLTDGSLYFDTQLYQGNGASTPGGSGSTQDFSNFAFAPSLVWIKDRSQSGHNNNLADIVRGAPNLLLSDVTNAEITDSTDGFTGFTNDGFTLGDNGEGTQSLELNKNGNSYVAWAWNAGSSNTSISVGGLNSSVYDQSQTWSSSTFFNDNGNGYNGSNTITKLFDGVAASVSADGVLAASGGDFTLSFGTTFSSASTVTFDLEGGGNALKINGSFVTLPGGSRTTVTYNVSGLTSIQWYHGAGSTYCYLLSIKVDGKELVDSGVTPPSVPSIASTVRANPTAGCSIVTYSGDSNTSKTIGHGLNATPEMIIIKCRNASGHWVVYHKSTGNNAFCRLDLPNGSDLGGTGVMNATSPTSSVFTVGDYSGTGSSSRNYVAYCFAPTEISKFGSYVGTGTSPNFVYLGFRPAFVILKSTTANNWVIYDSARTTHNLISKTIAADQDYAEADSGTNYGIDFLSNGFALRTTGGYMTNSNNASEGHTYIYGAWAENPFKISRAR